MKYTTLRDTYKILTFAMGLGLTYPNPKTEKRRVVCILISLLTIMPVSLMIFWDIYKCWLRRDILNIIRHCTIIGPFLGGFAKMLIMHLKRSAGKQIIDEIDRDYAMYNHLPPAYKAIVNTSIQKSLIYCERYWGITVLTCVTIFPLMATVLNIYNFLFKSEPEKYMIHDLNNPFAAPEDRFNSPYFELMFAYMMYCCFFYVINYLGYDGFFGLCINHACLKMDLYCKAFEDALKEKNENAIYEKIVGVIKEQNRLFEYVDLIQESFNKWLGMILIATMIQICNCMYHITEGFEFDVRYIIFIIGSVVHIYLPCRYSTKLKHESVETSTRLYCSGWEHTTSPRVRSTVLYMVARCQRPSEITAFNMLVFDMDLFVSILQTSYSMYTLLRS
ncbi:odorant receptor 4-like [Epargyreus clarus]|uniref:odorant receptor 4-like n=1 Tax=Epargyreus clarus TaxID=520877 RepID=UPI003C2F01D4